MVAHALGLAAHDVVVECRRMGGGFGGKETQMSLFACVRRARRAQDRARRQAAPRPRRRHALDRQAPRVRVLRYDVGFDDEGRILGLDLTLASRCGFSADLSGPVNDRAVFHADNAYWLPDVALHSFRCKTNTVSDTAFRGFGGPQGMFAIEHVIDEIARALGRDPLDVRDGQPVRHRRAQRHAVRHDGRGQHRADADRAARGARRAIASGARRSRSGIATIPVIKRGIALTPVKFGISFTATHYNQAGALAARVQRRHGAAEPRRHRDGPGPVHQGRAGRGARARRAARDACASRRRTRARCPNASPTAASSGSDLNGMAARDAARTLRERLAALRRAQVRLRCRPIVEFARRHGDARPARRCRSPSSRAPRTSRACSCSATGFYATPKIHYDRKTLTGRPFFYFAYGAAVSEVAIDTLTGEHRLLAVDILHDVGTSLNPAIDLGQIEGGFIQGWGWLAMEELWWNDKGELRDARAVHLQDPDRARRAGDASASTSTASPTARRRSTARKAVGEPPFMLALSAFHALRDAIASVAELPAVRRGSMRRRPTSASSRRDRGRAHATRGRMADAHARLARGARDSRRARTRRRAVLVTVAARDGLDAARSRAPRWSSTAHDAFGTIGGGHLEYEAIRLARDALRAVTTRRRSGSCAFRSRRGSANAAAASRRSRSRSSSTMRVRWLDTAVACARARRDRGDRVAHRRGATTARRTGRRPPTMPRGSLGDAALDSAAVAAARAAHRSAHGGSPRSVRFADRRRRRRCSSTSSCRATSTCSCSATATSGARSCRCSVRCRRTCAGSTRATPTFPATCPPTSRSSSTDAPEAELDAAPHGAYVVVMTHSHALDLRLVDRRARARRLALSRPDRLDIEAQPVREAPARARLRAGAPRARDLPDRRPAGSPSAARSRARSRSRSPRRCSRCASATEPHRTTCRPFRAALTTPAAKAAVADPRS